MLGYSRWSVLPDSLQLLTLVLLPLTVLSVSVSTTGRYFKDFESHLGAGGGIHLPIYRQESTLHKRGDQTGAIGLGDFIDVTYNVLVQVGGVDIPVVLDTGSSDLWVISDACNTNCVTRLPLYSQENFQSAGLDATILYGDSYTGTHANGPIGTDVVGLSGLVLQNQYFAAINDTNTSVLETGSAGIFGLGFPINSAIWSDVFVSEHRTSSALTSEQKRLQDLSQSESLRRSEAYLFPRSDFHQASFPKIPTFATLNNPIPRSVPKSRLNFPRQQITSITPEIIASYAVTGPLLSRIVVAGSLASPMFTVTLQRDSVDIGGNLGQLSIGELPPSVSSDSLTWVDIRGYPTSQGGLEPPPDSPNEVYPIAWELFVDDVYFDGEKLPRSTRSSSTISLSALLDTGNSLIRGPPDVIASIKSTLGGDTFPCATSHNLTFQIGGKLFPVDPRDFINQAYTNTVTNCVANLAPTDPPQEGKGYLHSWSLGTPFLKGVLATFYYGNITYPSQDPPRIGLLSTVPQDAGEELKGAVVVASSILNNFPGTSETAPTGTFTPASTASNGVPLATEVQNNTAGGRSNSATRTAIRTDSLTLALVFCAIVAERLLRL